MSSSKEHPLYVSHTVVLKMRIDIEMFKGMKLLPLPGFTYYLTIEGIIKASDEEIIDLDEFNRQTGLSVANCNVLTAITYLRFYWPPRYWKHLRCLQSIPGVNTPESLVLAIEHPVESLEYPGFYMIPGYSNYVISPSGDLYKRSPFTRLAASRGLLGYYTFRMTDDCGKTQNVLRHRILCYAFKPYPANVESLDVNHKDGVPGNDGLDNLEWCTRTENNNHAVQMGLNPDAQNVEIRDINTNRVFIFPSFTTAARHLNVTPTTIANRVKTMGLKAYSGLQFRLYPAAEPWPEIAENKGSYTVYFPDGTTKTCDSIEASRHVGVTPSSLYRLIRDGRDTGPSGVRVIRLEDSPPVQ